VWNISNILGSMINVTRCTCEVKCRIALVKAAFNKEKSLFNSKLHLNLKKKLVSCYIWSTPLYGAEEGWRGSPEPIMRKMKKCYTQ
jgi:hypothetical protein